MRLEAEANGKTVHVAVGGVLEIHLDENPTTGYSWEIAALDEEILADAGRVYFAARPALTGSGGEVQWLFRALKPGTTALRLEYRRPWEKDKPAQTFEITVAVE